jgi:hypothetical protein
MHLCPNFMHYVFLEEKGKDDIAEECRSTGRDLKPGPSEW